MFTIAQTDTPMNNSAILQKERYDYFLIWGNGISHKEEILDIIRSKPFIKTIKILNHKPKSIAKLVKTIYSYDYAPFQHLKSKTRYLLKTDPDVVFIFVHNQNVQEVYRGEGDFRHIECERITEIKREIRDKFNPRENGQRTEEHVIHTSDNESQVDHILKYLGNKKGADIFRNAPNPLLSLPYYLGKFDKFSIQRINASQLYCNIVMGNRKSYWKEVMPIEKTPQFLCLMGNTKPYQEYLSKFMGSLLTCDYSVENLMALSRNLRYLKDAYATAYILVKEFEANKYIILDGVHRASVLKYRGIENFPVGIVR